jgi:hypothetical protein
LIFTPDIFPDFSGEKPETGIPDPENRGSGPAGSQKILSDTTNKKNSEKIKQDCHKGGCQTRTTADEIVEYLGLMNQVR